MRAPVLIYSPSNATRYFLRGSKQVPIDLYDNKATYLESRYSAIACILILKPRILENIDVATVSNYKRLKLANRSITIYTPIYYLLLICVHD